MSQTNPNNESERRALTEDEREQFRTPVGDESPGIDESDDHPVKDAYDDDSDDGWKIDPRTGIRRFVELYERYDAFVREDLANGETACYRRAEYELEQEGYSEQELSEMSFRDVIETAREETGYEPVIEIEYTRGEKPVYAIHDNGCGISVREWGIFKEVGLSASHHEGGQLGKFGMGWLAKFKGAGYSNAILSWTKSVYDDASYSNAVTISDPEGYLPGDREQYGTTFKFTLCDEASDAIDMRSAVDEYASFLRVPVRYVEMNESGEELYNEDYPVQKLEDSYADDAPCITYTDPNDMFRIAASPEASHDAYLISVGIGLPYSARKKKNSPWKWDLRVNYEDGRIYDSADESHIGLVPIGEEAYERLPDEKKSDYILKSEMDESDKTLPEPTGSRDSFERHNVTEFVEYATQKIEEQFQERVQDVFETVGSFDDILELGPTDLEVYKKGYDRALTSGDRGMDLQERIKAYTGQTFSEKDCERMQKMRSMKVDFAPRNSRRVSRVKDRSRTALRDVLQHVGTEGTLYVGQTITKWKCDLVWAAHNQNMVVRVETDDYEEFKDLFDAKILTDIPSRRSPEKIVDHFDGVLSEERVRRITGNEKEETETSSELDPETRTITVRKSSSSKMNYTGKSIKESFEESGSIDVKYTSVDNLVLFPTTGEKSVTRHYGIAGRKKNTAVAKCPKYVYDYLIDTDGIYSYSEYIDEHRGKTVDTNDGPVALEAMDWHDVIVVASDDIEDIITEDIEAFREYLQDESDKVNPKDESRIAVVGPDFFDDCWRSMWHMKRHVKTPDVVTFGGKEPSFVSSRNLRGTDMLDFYKYMHLSDVPEDAPEMQIINKISGWSEDAKAVIDSLARLHNGDGLASQDSE